LKQSSSNDYRALSNSIIPTRDYLTFLGTTQLREIELLATDGSHSMVKIIRFIKKSSFKKNGKYKFVQHWASYHHMAS